MNKMVYLDVGWPVADLSVNEHYKMDDAARYFRQYVAALLPTNLGFFDDSMIAKLAGATIVASVLGQFDRFTSHFASFICTFCGLPNHVR